MLTMTKEEERMKEGLKLSKKQNWKGIGIHAAKFETSHRSISFQKNES